MTVLISSSLLSADFSILKDDIKALELAGVDRFHLDVMDNHYVPNLTFGPDLIKAIRPHTKLPFEVHLMVKNVDSLIPNIAQAGADIITVHPETTLHLHRTVMLIKSFGKKVGVALNPTTSIDCLKYIQDDIDHILIMTVNPGFGGQSFITSQLDKISEVRVLIGHRPIEVAVDGGINAQTAPLCRERGATVLIAGQAIFKDHHYQTNIAALR